MMNNVLLEAKDLNVSFKTPRGKVYALNGVNLQVKMEECVGLIGETGAGKSVTALAITRLIPPSFGLVSGKVLFGSKDLLRLSKKEMRRIRGSEISMIFQEPMTSLNPVLTVGYQISEVLKLHQKLLRDNIYAETIEALQLVKMPDPERTVRQYPHELSGGMKQRVMIAIAMVCKPKLLIADEPTTALDVTIQAQILSLMRDLKKQSKCSIIFISHDLGVISEICQRVYVLYAGTVVEHAEVKELLNNFFHPYTEALLKSIPPLKKRLNRLQTISGSIPDMAHLADGCPFSKRCQYGKDICNTNRPLLTELSPGHQVACHYPLFTQ